ncbi:hypothetical protein HNR33_004465 [Brassicibacter mesophilus]
MNQYHMVLDLKEDVTTLLQGFFCPAAEAVRKDGFLKGILKVALII